MYCFKAKNVHAGGYALAQDVEIRCLPGQVTLLSGPNGVGKSTLLNQVANQYSCHLYRPGFGLREELTVWQQALFFIKIFGQTKLDCKAVLAQVGLLQWRDDQVRTLSSGQRARLGMVFLIAGEAKLWLLDEPLNGLDYNSLTLLTNLLKTHLSNGGSVLLVSHLGVSTLKNLLSPIAFSEYVWRQGKIVQLSDQDSSPANSGLSDIKTDSPLEELNLATPWLALVDREFGLINAAKGNLMWSALFLFMILSFFGLALLKPALQTALAVIWVSVLLATLLSAKDWFVDDFKSGWFRLLLSARPLLASACWLVKIVSTLVGLLTITLPIVLLSAFIFNLPAGLIGSVIIALASGLFVVVPLLGLVSLMVFMTRGGAVLVYILALPLLVPTLIFGIEASQAELLGRSSLPVLSVLWSMSFAVLLLGPWVAKKLMALILD